MTLIIWRSGGGLVLSLGQLSEGHLSFDQEAR